MFTSTYKTVEIIVPERRYQALVQEWFDALDDGEIKRAITKIRWREIKPPLDWFRLDIITTHPFQAEAEEFSRRRETDDVDATMEALNRLGTRYAEWIEAEQMPEESVIDGRRSHVGWHPGEFPPYDPDLLPPQERAQHELHRQAATFLRLVHVTHQSETDLVKRTIGSNIPFFSAGGLVSWHCRIIRRFPTDFPETEDEKESLHERIHEDPADVLILMRLAHYYGCTLPLVRRILATREEFLRDNAAHLPIWLSEYRKMSDEEMNEPCLEPAAYEVLDAAFEAYHHAVGAAIEGHEGELAEAINSFLPSLPIPDGFFASELRDDGDWWKQ